MRKFLNRLLSIITILSILIVGGLLLLSPQKTSPFLDDDGNTLANSIADIRTVTLNGSEQRILIRGRDINNPVLLHLHGGPGGADQAIVRSSGKTVEDLFTVVYWDQRGAGASYSSELDLGSLSLKQIVDDGLALTELLRDEFAKDKIYLQGHSWGTLVGVHMVAGAPALYHAYFGIGQIANSRQAELLSYNYTLDQAQRAGDVDTIDGLKHIGQPPYQKDQRWIDTAMVGRGLMRPYEIPSQPLLLSLFDIYKNFVFYPAYSISDKLNSLEGSKVSFQKLWMQAINADLFTSHKSLKVPLHFFQGKYDMHTVTEVAKNYYEMVEAPDKQYYSFDNSAHWPHIREYGKYRNILQSILKQRQ